MKLTIISGRSGSGKSIALHVLEDLGYYCVDNLPVQLIPDLTQEISNHHSRIAISIDSRNIPANLSNFRKIIKNFKAQGNSLEILYLDADDSILLTRYSETRRKHPLTSNQVTLKEALKEELSLLSPIANIASLTINTSNLSNGQLCTIIRDRNKFESGSSLNLLIKSFGFKYGIPPDADFVFDVRCLPNPYWVSHLRKLPGNNPEVQAYFNQEPLVASMVSDIYKFLATWLEKFAADNRSYMTVAIGCTGGKHRSVFVAESLISCSKKLVDNVQLRHRDIDH